MPALEDRAAYNLGVVVQETGINPDTLRAWERRYGLPKPARSPGGHRLYSQEDISLVRWLQGRQAEGMRIGRAVDLWNQIKESGRDPYQEHPISAAERISGLEERLRPGQGGDERRVYQGAQQAWLAAAVNFNEQKAEQILSGDFARFSPEEVWLQIILPVLDEVGARWKQNQLTVQQEHFISSLISRHLGAQIDAAPPPIREETLLAACPPGERHELTLLMITLLFRRRGYRVVYLGADVPGQDLGQAIRAARPNLILLAAQTLSAAASYQRLAVKFQNYGVPIGFGGRIYNRIPELRDRSPGFFLGEEINLVVNKVEGLFAQPPPEMPAGGAPPEVFQRTLSSYLIEEQRAAGKVIEIGRNYGLDERHLLLANRYLRQGLAASMELGNLDDLHPDLIWLGQLLSYRGISREQIKRYLGIYADQLEVQGGSSVELVVSWLRSARDELMD